MYNYSIIVLTTLFLSWALFSPHALGGEYNAAAALGSSTCRATEIEVSQGVESSMGIPSYRVEITNLCGCTVEQLRLHCGMFASANVVDPSLFKRISYDDCLVNAGRPLPIGKAIAFHYSNTRPYPLSVKSFVCHQ